MAAACAVYLDYNATAPLRPEARAALLEACGEVGNPSSIHAFGRRARRRLEDAREAICARLGVAPARLVFTSGGTEANHLALAQARGGPVVVSAIEHPSVLEAVPDAHRAPVTSTGEVDLDALARLLAAHRPALVSIMLANNETGVVQPLAEVAELCRRSGVLLHVDAVQGPGRCPLGPALEGAHFVSLSAHKIGGPVGIGALLVPDPFTLVPLLRGGGQERRRRAGTENVPGACGFAAAFQALSEAETARLSTLRDRLERELEARVPEVRIIGREAPRLANTSCIALPGVPAELQVVRLDLEGFAVSAGSACSSGKVARSHVLEAMGLPPEIAGCAIRVSLGWRTTAAEIDAFVEAWARTVPALREAATALAPAPARTR